MHKVIATLTASAVLGAGAFGIATISPAAATDTPPATAAAGAKVGHGRGAFLQTLLDNAVADGTISQAQADAILAKAKALGPERAGRLVKGAAQVAADTIGISPAELRDAVKGGKTIAQVAEDHGKTGQEVIDAIVAAANTKIDKAVADGKLDAARAAQMKTKLVDRVTKLVNETPHRK
jgi:ribosomal protein S20